MGQIYSVADGYALNSSFGGTWGAVRDSATASSTDSTKTSHNLAVAAHIVTGFFTLPLISRTFVRFDCSGVTSTLSAASLKIYGNTKFGRGDAEDFWIVKSTALTTGIGGDFLVATADYDAITGWDTSSPTTDGSGNGDQSSNVTLYSDVYDISGGWSTSAYNTISLNAQARSDLVSQDTFTICIISDGDLRDVPESIGFGVTLNSMGMFFEDNAGTSKDPYIDYTEGEEESSVVYNSVFFGTSF